MKNNHIALQKHSKPSPSLASRYADTVRQSSEKLSEPLTDQLIGETFEQELKELTVMYREAKRRDAQTKKEFQRILKDHIAKDIS